MNHVKKIAHGASTSKCHLSTECMDIVSRLSLGENVSVFPDYVFERTHFKATKNKTTKYALQWLFYFVGY